MKCDLRANGNRAFLNLWLQPSGLQRTTGITRTTETTKTTQTATNKRVECWIGGNHGNDRQWRKPKESRVQTKGSPNEALRKGPPFHGSRSSREIKYKHSECKLPNRRSRSYKAIKLFLSAGKWAVAKSQGDKSASQSSMELYYQWISGPLRVFVFRLKQETSGKPLFTDKTETASSPKL